MPRSPVFSLHPHELSNLCQNAEAWVMKKRCYLAAAATSYSLQPAEKQADTPFSGGVQPGCGLNQGILAGIPYPNTHNPS